MKHVLFIVIAMLTGMAFTSQAQDNYWDYSWTETNGGPVWGSEIPESFSPAVQNMDTCTIDGIQYLYACGIFAVEEENYGEITIQQTGIIFYDGSVWKNLRPTTSEVVHYFKFQGNEYIATIEGYTPGVDTYLGGIKKWNGNSWQNIWETESACGIAFVDTARDRVIFTQVLPTIMPDGETIAPYTFLLSSDGVTIDTIGKFRGAANDYDQVGNRGYLTVSPMPDEYGGYTKGLFAIDLDSMKFIEYNLDDYPYFSVSSIFLQVETNYEKTELYVREVLGAILKREVDGSWTHLTEDGNYWYFNSSDEGMIVSGDLLCGYTSFYNDGAFDDIAFQSSNGLPSSVRICKYKDKWYSWKGGILSDTRGLVHPNDPDDPYALLYMESNILVRMLTSEIPEDTVENPDAISAIDMDKIKIYPNPATDKITVESNTILDNDMRISIYNITDQKMPVDIQIVNDHTISIDVSKLPRGIYSVMNKLIILQ